MDKLHDLKKWMNVYATELASTCYATIPMAEKRKDETMEDYHKRRDKEALDVMKQIEILEGDG